MLPFAPPIAPVKQSAPFSDPDWLFEVKHDGWRCLAFVDGDCRLMSRNGNRFNRFKQVARFLSGLPHQAVIDGELVCFDDQGRTRFDDLMFNQGQTHLCAFDLLWLDGHDLRDQPCIERKQRLRQIIDAAGAGRLQFVDHIEAEGEALFEQVCARDMEGIVAKPQQSAYRPLRRGPWIKIKNPDYTQTEGRGELFNPT